MNGWPENEEDDRPALVMDEKTRERHLKALRWTWLIVLSFATALTLWASGQAGSRAIQQESIAREWMSHWPAAMRGLPMEGAKTCPTGPSEECAAISTVTTDFAGNSRTTRVFAWPDPAQNWAVAWIPFEQWRLAREIALRANKTEYGRRLIQLGPRGREPQLGVADVFWRIFWGDDSEQASWRVGMIVPPAPPEGKDGGSKLADPKLAESFADEPPFRIPSPNGPIALFADGMRLPARLQSGHWMILAQGPAEEAVKMAQALQAPPAADQWISPEQGAADSAAADARSGASLAGGDIAPSDAEDKAPGGPGAPGALHGSKASIARAMAADKGETGKGGVAKAEEKLTESASLEKTREKSAAGGIISDDSERATPASGDPMDRNSGYNSPWQAPHRPFDAGGELVNIAMRMGSR